MRTYMPRRFKQALLCTTPHSLNPMVEHVFVALFHHMMNSRRGSPR